MKKITIWSMAGLIMLWAMGPWVMAQKVSLTDYKTQLEAALGEMIIAVQKTTRYPASSLTQVFNFTVDRGAGRTEVVPVQVVFVKSEGGYTVQSMYDKHVLGHGGPEDDPIADPRADLQRGRGRRGRLRHEPSCPEQVRAVQKPVLSVRTQHTA